MTDQTQTSFDDTCGLIQVHGNLRGQRVPNGKGGFTWYIDDFVADDGAEFAFTQSDVPEVICAEPTNVEIPF